MYRFLLLFITTMPMGVVLGLFIGSPVAHALVQFLVGITIDVAAGHFIIYSNILDEDFGDFRVSLLPCLNKTLAPRKAARTHATT
jgi:hypothetical protein